MNRRRTKRPLERLRSSWTSTADLEETLTAMFADPPVNLTGDANAKPPDNLIGGTATRAPADKLSGGHSDSLVRQDAQRIPNLAINDPTGFQVVPPDNLTGGFQDVNGDDDANVWPPDNLTGGTETLVPPDKLTGYHPAKLGQQDLHRVLNPTVADRIPSQLLYPPDNLTGGFQTVNGDVVDARFTRAYDSVQSAHTPSEHLVYTTMWKMLGTRDDDSPSREGILPMAAVAQKASISLRNVRRVLRSLEQKFAIEVTEYEDKTRSIPRRYRVWGFKSTLERRRRAGYAYIYRNRNLITLARPHGNSEITSKPSGGAPDNLTGGQPDNLTRELGASLSGGAEDKLAGKPPDNLSASSINTSSKRTKATSSSETFTVSAVIAKAVREELGFIDDDALIHLIRRSRERAADATDEEIADFAKIAAHRIRLMRNLTNPVGLLITQVPKHFEGQSFALYREEKRKAREIQRQISLEQRKQAQDILKDPDAEPFEREWAQTVIEAPEDEI